ncbi:MAG TPA: phosphoglycolate phosphatase [Pseudoxanthomonas sp.]|nr:phosphoglycolate phosphatase [Pseudoxanthomonas sp.]
MRIQAGMSAKGFPRVALFDLDGTLLDSAPDLLAAANRVRERRDLPPMLLEELRPHVSKGSRAMLAAAFPHVDAAQREAWMPEFLGLYQHEIGKHGVLFDGVAEMLAALEADGARWGIVTNKPEYLARDILPHFGWTERCAVLIGGDTLAEKKPHPLPLQVAARLLDTGIADCVYVGDDQRDIQSARAAGMRSVAALWGYRPPEDEPRLWQADTMVGTARELIDPAVWPWR